MTIRELCPAIGSALHVLDVQRWAAPLVRAGLLPRVGAKVHSRPQEALTGALYRSLVFGTPNPTTRILSHPTAEAAGWRMTEAETREAAELMLTDHRTIRKAPARLTRPTTLPSYGDVTSS